MLFVLSSLLLLSFCHSEDRPLVTTPLGKILGTHKKSFNERTFSAFEGIPYAKPPIGNQRFQKPEPIEKWDQVLDASHLYTCAQTTPFSLDIKVSGTENCLYINVYVPRDQPSRGANLDVIVHIHGGGFMFSSGQGYAHPGYLMDHDIIYVTFNYRLGILGFLSTEDEVLPGNNGMKDQVLALKWVRDNIDSFGGNPNSITLNGASAGGSSVHLHYFSPLSRGLFHRGLSQSGCALNPFVIKRGALAKAKILAASLGCPTEPSEDLVKCLKTKDYEEMLLKIRLFFGYKFYPVAAFGPVIEPEGVGAFLSEEPVRRLEKGQVEDVPWVASFVPHEGGTLFPDLSKDPSVLNPVWNEVAALLLYYNSTLPKEKASSVAAKIKQFYLGPEEDFAIDNAPKFINMGTDRLLLQGIVKSAELQAAKTTSPVYLYKLSYTGDSKKVVEHADDNQYFFSNQYDRQPTENELKMKNVMVDMFVALAKTGKPKINGVNWKPVKEDQVNFLNISGFRIEDIKPEVGTNLGNGQFWESLGLLENGNLETSAKNT